MRVHYRCLLKTYKNRFDANIMKIKVSLETKFFEFGLVWLVYLTGDTMISFLLLRITLNNE